MRFSITLSLAALVLLSGCDAVFTSDADRQTVIASANDAAVPDSVRALYRDDAARLALRQIQEEGGAASRPVELPDEPAASIYNALISVYNATSLEGRDAVVGLHTFPNPETHRLYLSVELGTAWVTAWTEGRRITGNDTVDELIRTYDLELDRFRQIPDYYYNATLYSKAPLNLKALAKRFEGLSGLRYAEPGSWIGDDDDIEATSGDGYWTLRYSVGYGDCPAGCISRHVWTYRIAADGRVTFEGESGDPLPPEGTVIP